MRELSPEIGPKQEIQMVLQNLQAEPEWDILERIEHLHSNAESHSILATLEGYAHVRRNTDPASEEGFLQLVTTLGDLLQQTGFGLLYPLTYSELKDIREGLKSLGQYGDRDTISVFLIEIIRRIDLSSFFSSRNNMRTHMMRSERISRIEEMLLLDLQKGLRNNGTSGSGDLVELLQSLDTVILERRPEDTVAISKNRLRLISDLSNLTKIPYMLDRLLPYTFGETSGVNHILRNLRLSTHIRNLGTALERKTTDSSEIERWLLGIMDLTTVMLDGSLDITQVQIVIRGLHHIGEYAPKERVEWWFAMINSVGTAYDECVKDFIPAYHEAYSPNKLNRKGKRFY